MFSTCKCMLLSKSFNFDLLFGLSNFFLWVLIRIKLQIFISETEGYSGDISFLPSLKTVGLKLFIICLLRGNWFAQKVIYAGRNKMVNTTAPKRCFRKYMYVFHSISAIAACKFYLPHNNIYFQCYIAITSFLISRTCEIRFHDVMGQNTICIPTQKF